MLRKLQEKASWWQLWGTLDETGAQEILKLLGEKKILEDHPIFISVGSVVQAQLHGQPDPLQ